jgi:hypothetical protein
MERASYSVTGLKELPHHREKTEMDDFIDSLPGFTRARVTEDATAIYQYHQQNLVGFT